MAVGTIPRRLRFPHLLQRHFMDAISPEVVDQQTAKILREKTPGERLAIAHGMWRSARTMLLSALRGQHPDWTDEQVRREAARRLSHGAV